MILKKFFIYISLICKEINLLIEYLNNNNIDIAVQYIKNLSNTKFIKNMVMGNLKCIRSCQIFDFTNLS